MLFKLITHVQFNSFHLKAKYTFLFLVLSATVSCGIKLGQKNEPPAPAKVESVKCLQLSIKNLKSYLVGDANDDQVASSMQCLQDVFADFKENIRGESKDSYTAREISTFVQSNFYSDAYPLSDEFLDQLMKLKVALIGGNSKSIKITEIDQISKLLGTLEPNLVQINKSMKILTSNWTLQLQPVSADEKELQFLTAKKDLNSLIHKLSLEFIRTGNAYSIDDLVNLVKEGAILTKADKLTLELIERARPFVKVFKTTLIGGDYSLQNDEWVRLGLILNEGLFQKLRFDYFLKDLKPNEVELKWNGYEKIASDLSGLLETLLISKQTRTLSNFELYELSKTLRLINPDFSLSLTLFDSLGHVKVMLLGDSPSGRLGWSSSDFASLKQKLPVLFQQLSLIVTTYGLLQDDTKNFRTTIQYSDFVIAEAKIFNSVQEITTLIEKPYNLYSLKQLILELSRGPLKNIFVIPDNFESLFNVALAVKTTITGQQDNEISVDNLKLLLKVGIRGAFNYLEYNLFLKPLQTQTETQKPRYLSVFERFFQNVATTIDMNLQLKAKPFYSSAEFSQLILTLQQEKMLTTILTSEGLTPALNGLWSHVLNSPELRLQGKLLPGFNHVALEQLSQEILIYLKVQGSMSALFQDHPLLSQATLLEEIHRLLGLSDSPLLTTGLLELKNLLESGSPLNFNKFGFLKIATADVGQYQMQDLAQSNLSRALSRIAIRSYATEAKRVDPLTGITLEEGNTAYLQFAGVIKDLGFLNSVDTQFISSRFREASLFLSNSDGTAVAGFAQLHHLILHIFSGVGRADMMKTKILKSCLPPQNDIATADLVVWEDCLLKFYATETEAFSDLPGFLNLRTKFTETQLKEFYSSLLKAAGHVPNEKKIVHLSDAALFPHIVQYVEMVFSRFDVDKDQSLDKNEALVAFPVYHDLIRELTKELKLTEADLPGVFIYLLKNGRPPKGILEKLAFITFIRNPDKWIIQSTRLDLGKIFNFIADSIKQKQEAPVVPPVAPVTPVKP